jgi:methionyl-tRNA synthetase
MLTVWFTGNLLNRLTSPSLNPGQVRPAWRPDYAAYETPLSRELQERLASLPEAVEAAYESFHFYQGIVAIMDVLRLTNTFVQVTTGERGARGGQETC